MLWLLALLPVALLAALLLLPLRLRIRAQSDPPRLRVGLRPMGPLLPWIGLMDTDRPRQARQPGTKGKKTPQARTQARQTHRLHAGLDLLGSVWRALWVEHLRVQARFGLGDPADTGQAFGVLALFVYNWPQHFALAPDFSGPVFEGAADLCLAITPARLIGPGVRLAWAWRRA